MDLDIFQAKIKFVGKMQIKGKLCCIFFSFLSSIQRFLRTFSLKLTNTWLSIATFYKTICVKSEYIKKVNTNVTETVVSSFYLIQFFNSMKRLEKQLGDQNSNNSKKLSLLLISTKFGARANRITKLRF